MSTTSYMVLTLPDVGVTAGPTWATYLNAALTAVDSHDHSSGKGALVTPSGLNINADLTFGGNNATNLKTTTFSNNGASLSSGFQNCTYVANGDLYYNNGSGTTIQLTSGSSLNVGSVNGISGLAAPASASFSTPDFIFKSAATTYGKIDSGDLKIFPFSAGATNAVTVKASTSLASSYSLTLPLALPGSTQYVASDSSGNLSFSSADTIAAAMTSTGANSVASTMNSTGANAIASTMTSTGANAIVDDYTRPTGSTVAARGVGRSASSASQTTTSSTFVEVTGSDVVITTSGRPVLLCINSTSTTVGSGAVVDTNSTTGQNITVTYGFKRDTTVLGAYEHSVSGFTAVSPGSFRIAPTGVFIDEVAAGTYTYKIVFAKDGIGSSNSTARILNVKLVAFEL